MNLGITRSKHIYLIIKVHSKDLPAGRQAGKKRTQKPFSLFNQAYQGFYAFSLSRGQFPLR